MPKKPSMMTAAFGRNEEERKKPKKLPAPVGGELKPLCKKVTPLEGRHQCAFVIGDPRTDQWSYCGRETIPASSYCETHESRCINLTVRR